MADESAKCLSSLCIPRKKRPSEVEATQVSVRRVRRGDEDAYDFSSPRLAKRRHSSTKSDKHVLKKPYAARTLASSTVTVEDPGSALQHPVFEPDAPLLDDTSLSSAMKTTCTEAQPVQVISAYVHQVKHERAFALCDLSLKYFVIQDFSTKTLSLQPWEFQFVSRLAKSFNSDFHWVYSCSCNESRANLIGSLGPFVNQSIDKCKLIEDECFHILASKSLVSEFDSLHDIIPEQEYQDHSYHLSKRAALWMKDGELCKEFVPIGRDGGVCIFSEMSFGVVHVDGKGIRCCTCRYGKYECSHVKKIACLVEDTADDLPDILKPFCAILASRPKKPTNFTTTSCASQKPIPFELSSKLKSVLQQTYEERFSILSRTAHLVPDVSEACPVCGGHCWSDQMLSRESIVITMSCTYSAKVYERLCNCGAILHFDGQSAALLNMSSHLVCYEVLRNFMFHFLHGRATMNTEYKVLCESHSDAGDDTFQDSFSYNHYRQAWYSFLNLLDIDLSEGFSCSICQNHPQSLIMDATSVAFRRNLDYWTPLQDVQCENPKEGSKYSERVFVPHQHTRTLLSRFSKLGLSHTDLVQLVELLKEHSPALIPLLEYFQEASSSSSHLHCPAQWKSLVAVLASSSPVCASVHPSPPLFQLLLSMKSENVLKNVDAMQLLQREVPVLFNLLDTLKYVPHKLLSPILDVLIEKSKAPFTISSSQSESHNSDDHDLTFFPALSIYRRRDTYKADTSQKPKICTKHSTGHPSLLPGVFTLFCHHGICYGFKVMRVRESPNLPFTILYTRFKEGPKEVIYDNSCNLHNYCLNREPTYFQHTWFLVDRFHWANHNCSTGYHMAQYPQFTSINSQVVEQSNSMLKRTKSMLAYMNPQNFMRHLKFYLWFQNRRRPKDIV